MHCTPCLRITGDALQRTSACSISRGEECKAANSLGMFDVIKEDDDVEVDCGDDSSSSSASLSSDSTFDDFILRPCVISALKDPWHPQSVLSFFTGIDFSHSSALHSLVKTSNFAQKIYPMICREGRQYRKLCRKFVDVIRAAGRNQLISTKECNWVSVDGTVAQLLLCGQMARTCFSGTGEACAYDHVSVRLSRELQAMVTETSRKKEKIAKRLSSSMENGITKKKNPNRKLRRSYASMSILGIMYSHTSEKKAHLPSLEDRYADRRLSNEKERKLSISKFIPPECVEVWSFSCTSSSKSNTIGRSRTTSTESLSSLDCDVSGDVDGINFDSESFDAEYKYQSIDESDGKLEVDIIIQRAQSLHCA